MIALDVETGGLDPERNPILSIGALDTDNPTNQFYGECRAWERAEITDEALAINGFSLEQTTDEKKQTEAELIKIFLAWVAEVKDKMIVGQNSSFDRDFIKAACRRAGLQSPFGHRTLDTHSLVWLHMIEHGVTPPAILNLTACLEYCGLPPEAKPHNALNGAIAHAQVFAKIAYNKKIFYA